MNRLTVVSLFNLLTLFSAVGSASERAPGAHEHTGANVACSAEKLQIAQEMAEQARSSTDPSQRQQHLYQALDHCLRFDWLMDAGAMDAQSGRWLAAARAFGNAARLAQQLSGNQLEEKQLLALAYEALSWLQAGSLDLATAAVTEADNGYRSLNLARPDFLLPLMREVDTALVSADAETLADALQQQFTRGLSRGISVKPKVSLQVLFEFDSDQLTVEGHKMTQKIADAIDIVLNRRALRDTATAHNASTPRIRLIGHTDRLGSEDYNRGLSEQRAAAVAKQIIALNGDTDIEQWLEITGRGENEPRYNGSSDNDHRLNRRVELVITR